MTRRFLRLVCRALIGAVLFAQMAVSAYACPGLLAATTMAVPVSAELPSGTESTAAVTAAVTAAASAAPALPMMNCEDMAMPMDAAFPNLCAEHCHQGQQSDQAATLTVPAALLTELYITPPAPEPIVAPRPAAATASALDAASPPLAILHCCFRI